MTTLRINRAPVLTLWAAVVAERLGSSWETALTGGQAVASMAAPARAAMGRLTASLPAVALNKQAFHLYEQFRPEVAADEKGWGAKGVLDLAKIEALAKRR